jgi:hypothetical protein
MYIFSFTNYTKKKVQLFLGLEKSMISVNLYSNSSKELEKFLSSFYSSSFNLTNVLSWKHLYDNPIEIADIVGVYADNFNDFKIMMLICLDKGLYIHVTNENADNLIKYLFERYPY